MTIPYLPPETASGNINLVYVTAPFYSNIWFYIGLVAILIGLGFTLWAWFKFNIKNRTNFRIHFNDKKVITYSFKNVINDYHEFNYGKKDVDINGKKLMHKHHIIPECIEYGFFGRYLDYPVGDIEPINFQNINKNEFNMTEFNKSMTAYMNSETLAMLLVFGKLKELLIMLLWIIIGIAVIGFIIVILIQILHNPSSTCKLMPDNQTLSTLRIAIGK